MLRLLPLRKRLNARDGATEDQGMNVVGALIGIHGLQVRGVPHHVIFDLDAVAAVHVTRGAGDVECVAASGRFNCLRSSVYCRALCMQSSAAPSAPQEMP